MESWCGVAGGATDPEESAATDAEESDINVNDVDVDLDPEQKRFCNSKQMLDHEGRHARNSDVNRDVVDFGAVSIGGEPPKGASVQNNFNKSALGSSTCDDSTSTSTAKMAPPETVVLVPSECGSSKEITKEA